MGYTQTPGRGPISKYGALKQKGLLNPTNPNKNIRKSARFFHGGKTFIEKINPFDRQSADKRKYKKETLKNIVSNIPPASPPNRPKARLLISFSNTPMQYDRGFKKFGKPKPLANKGDAAKKKIRKEKFITGLKTTAVVGFPILGGYITTKIRNKAYGL